MKCNADIFVRKLSQRYYIAPKNQPKKAIGRSKSREYMLGSRKKATYNCGGLNYVLRGRSIARKNRSSRACARKQLGNIVER